MTRPKTWRLTTAFAMMVACGGRQKVHVESVVPSDRTVYFPSPLMQDGNSPLTYVVKPNSAVDYSASFVSGTLVERKSNAEVSELISASDGLRVAGGFEQAHIAAGTKDVTHLVIDARVERVQLVRDIKYNERSKCCRKTGLSASCRGGYIESVLIGTGTVTFARMRGPARMREPSVGMAEHRDDAGKKRFVLRSELEMIKTRTFQDSYFAFTAASADRACEFSR